VCVNLHRTGGFGGLDLRSRLDTAELPPAEAAEVDEVRPLLQRLVEAARRG
jgi:hypothetical protein